MIDYHYPNGPKTKITYMGITQTPSNIAMMIGLPVGFRTLLDGIRQNMPPSELLNPETYGVSLTKYTVRGFTGTIPEIFKKFADPDKITMSILSSRLRSGTEEELLFVTSRELRQYRYKAQVERGEAPHDFV